MKMNSFLSRSCDNFGTVLKTDGNLGLWRYPTRGQYYVNINVLSLRGAVSLDDESWRDLIANPKESSDSVYEPVTHMSSPHSYVREYVPGLQPEIWTYSCEGVHGRRVEQIPSNVHDQGAQRRGASKLLRSLKRFKHKLMTSKSKKGVEPYTNDECSGSYHEIQICTSSTTRHKDDKIPEMVDTWEQRNAGTKQSSQNHLRKSVETAFVHQSNKVNWLSSRPEMLSSPEPRFPSECHTYPDIIKSHSDPSNRRDGPRNDSHSMLCDSHAVRQSDNQNTRRGRKCNLKRQTVIRIPSNDKLLHAKPGLQEMQSFRQEVHQHTSSSNKAVRCEIYVSKQASIVSIDKNSIAIEKNVTSSSHVSNNNTTVSNKKNNVSKQRKYVSNKKQVSIENNNVSNEKNNFSNQNNVFNEKHNVSNKNKVSNEKCHVSNEKHNVSNKKNNVTNKSSAC
ncbi:transcription initiation factor TFIID subunit 1-like [Liolophura sinensis]|uniref:transcription initiation factor TFIID subunit 1-like n=1 Tax=Liolophura sinensis TaxID=3198878 RepID=UPI003158505F